jgi:hypothetical protein
MRFAAMSLTKDIKRALDALALAHAADYLSQHEKEAVLGVIPAESAPKPDSTGATPSTVVPLHQLPQVALVADSGLPEHLVDYALDTCRHFKAGLIVIDTQPHQASRLAEPLQEIKAANVPLTVTSLPEATMATLHEFALNQSRLLFVIISGAANQSLRAAQMQWHSPAPLVVVSEQMPQQAPAAVSLHS